MINKPTILVVDDTPANLQLMSGLLQEDYKVKAATSGEKALKIAFTDPQPDLILLDIMMPEMDGYEVCKRLKADEKANQIPIIFLTAKAETQDEALGLSLGAVDYITKPVSPPIAMARIKTHIELYRQKKALIESQRLLAEEINEAAIYIRSLLPPPLEGKVNTSWQHIPCSSLGGDAFGYHWIDEDHLGIYLVDVCGHGVGAAILCISVINAIRSQSLTDTDFKSPASVLKGLNDAFPMEEQNNKYFTIWYGVYNQKNHELIFSSAGHPHAILFSGNDIKNKKLQTLTSGGLAIGMMPGIEFKETTVPLSNRNKLYVFSDGVYEITQKGGKEMNLTDYTNLMSDHFSHFELLQSDKVLEKITSLKEEAGPFEDDFSIVELIINS
jgi:sigma-B regulation protein RsbU (phosphoserine phosphatase)